jgi:hypothetical protein
MFNETALNSSLPLPHWLAEVLVGDRLPRFRKAGIATAASA